MEERDCRFRKRKKAYQRPPIFDFSNTNTHPDPLPTHTRYNHTQIYSPPTSYSRIYTTDKYCPNLPHSHANTKWSAWKGMLVLLLRRHRDHNRSRGSFPILLPCGFVVWWVAFPNIDPGHCCCFYYQSFEIVPEYDSSSRSYSNNTILTLPRRPQTFPPAAGNVSPHHSYLVDTL